MTDPDARGGPGAWDVPEGIFREYDIRGLVGDELSPAVARLVGRAFGSLLADRADPVVAVGEDNRPSSPELARAVCEGLNGAGVAAWRLGTVPTPALYYADRVLEVDGGIQVTGSHNPPAYNGLKMVVDGRALHGDEIRGLRERIVAGDLASGSAPTERREILDRYVEEIVGRLGPVPSDVSLVLDCGNGTGSLAAPRVLREMGVDLVPLYCESDGTFPNHHPDPTVDENLRDLVRAVGEREGTFGVGLDGDGDRIGVVSEEGGIVRGDRLLLIFALDLLERRPGAEVVFDVKCSMALPEMIEEAGGVPVMWKTGHSLIKERMRRGDAPLAGEMSGHICFADEYLGFDDAVYAAARLAVLVARSGRSVAELAGRIPSYPSTPELRLECPDDRKFGVVERVAERFRDERPVSEVDGVRVDFGDGWALVRASNTQPAVVVRIEARTPEGLAEIHGVMGEALADAGLGLPELAARARG